MKLPEHKDVERLLRSHGWLLDEMREVPTDNAGAVGGMLSGVVDAEASALESCLQLTAVGIRRSPGQFPARQLELLVGQSGVQIVSVDGKSTVGPTPRVTTTRVMMAKLPD